MIEHLDLVLRRTLVAAVPPLATRIGFQPPDAEWRQAVGSPPGTWLNCALVDLREDRHHRTTGVRVERDPLRRVLPPFLMRCHYLLSAWSSGNDRVQATSDEHGLLGQVVAALVEAAPLTPASVLVPGELVNLPPAWREAAFDTDVLPPEGFVKIAEFWGTMGRSTPWRPVAWVAVTVPVEPPPRTVDGIVTTVVATIGSGVPVPAANEVLVTVGGVVRDGTGPNAAAPVPIADASVRITDAADHLLGWAVTADDGRFVIEGVPPGSWTASVRAAGLPALGPVPLTLPTPGPGPVELVFS